MPTTRERVTRCWTTRHACAVAALAFAWAGCYSNPPTPITSVVIYWDFVRHKADGTAVVYDASLSAVATGPCPDGSSGCGPCAESGVDFVVLTRADGTLVDSTRPTVPCVYYGLHGATALQVAPGPQVFRVTGYRGGGGASVALYDGEVSVDVIAGVFNETTVHAQGIPGDLSIEVQFADAAGTPIGTSCASAGQQSLFHELRDFAGTVVAEGPMTCAPSAGISYLGSQGLDRDRYTIRVQGFASASPPPGADPDYDSLSSAAPPGQSCSGQPFDHYGDDVATPWKVTAFDVIAKPPPCP